MSVKMVDIPFFIVENGNPESRPSSVVHSLHRLSNE